MKLNEAEINKFMPKGWVMVPTANGAGTIYDCMDGDGQAYEREMHRASFTIRACYSRIEELEQSNPAPRPWKPGDNPGEKLSEKLRRLENRLFMPGTPPALTRAVEDLENHAAALANEIQANLTAIPAQFRVEVREEGPAASLAVSLSNLLQHVKDLQEALDDKVRVTREISDLIDPVAQGGATTPALIDVQAQLSRDLPMMIRLIDERFTSDLPAEVAHNMVERYKHLLKR